MLSELEEAALRTMPGFQQALKHLTGEDVLEEIREKKRERDQEVPRNADGTWRHANPRMNPHREDGLYGKAAQAADGDWYGSH